MEEFDINKESSDIEKTLADVMKIEKKKKEDQLNRDELEESSLKIAKQLQELNDTIQGGIRSANLREYRNTYVINAQDSLDDAYDMLVHFNIISEMTKIISIKLSFWLLPFRSYSKAGASQGTPSGGGSTSGSGGGQTSSATGTPSGGGSTSGSKTTPSGGGSTSGGQGSASGGGATSGAGGGQTSSYKTTPSGGTSTTGYEGSASGGGDTSGSGGGQTSSSSNIITSTGYCSDVGGFWKNVEGIYEILTHDGVVSIIGHTHTVANHQHTTPNHTHPNHRHSTPNHTHPSHAHTVANHYHSTPAHTHPNHYHTTPNHTHPSHTHTTPNHTHPNHTHTVANHTHSTPNHTHPNHTHSAVYGIFEEETSPTIMVYISRDNGLTYSLPVGSYTNDQETLDITRFIDTKGSKMIKFTSTTRARLSVQIEIKLDIKAR